MRRSHSKFPFDSICEPPLRRHHHQHFPQHPVARNNGCHQQDRPQLAVPAEPLRAGDRDRRRSLRPREQHTGPEGQPSSPAVRLCPRGKNCCPRLPTCELNRSGMASVNFRGIFDAPGYNGRICGLISIHIHQRQKITNMERNHQQRRQNTNGHENLQSKTPFQEEFCFCVPDTLNRTTL